MMQGTLAEKRDRAMESRDSTEALKLGTDVGGRGVV